jgi:putative SOS response-associated peptidase YedK
MCYSAQIIADYRRYVRMFGANMSLREFAILFYERAEGNSTIKIPKGMEAPFAEPQSDAEREIKASIDRFKEAEKIRLEQALFAQRERFAKAEAALAIKQTKAAAESRRIATAKIDDLLRKLADLGPSIAVDGEGRIFPGWYAPVMIVQDGQRVVVPMRYRCRLPGWTEQMEKQKPGTYNARRDSLATAWRKLFGYQHGVVVISHFYENVAQHGRNVVLRFDPSPPQDLLVACLWTRTPVPGAADLWSFAAITDEPPPEIAAAGHDRCIITIKPENLDAWLNPDPTDLAALDAILDDSSRPYYEHQLAA